jgi:hypothetical protein
LFPGSSFIDAVTKRLSSCIDDLGPLIEANLRKQGIEITEENFLNELIKQYEEALNSEVLRENLPIKKVFPSQQMASTDEVLQAAIRIVVGHKATNQDATVDPGDKGYDPVLEFCLDNLNEVMMAASHFPDVDNDTFMNCLQQIEDCLKNSVNILVND